MVSKANYFYRSSEKSLLKKTDDFLLSLLLAKFTSKH